MTIFQKQTVLIFSKQKTVLLHIDLILKNTIIISNNISSKVLNKIVINKHLKIKKNNSKMKKNAQHEELQRQTNIAFRDSFCLKFYILTQFYKDNLYYSQYNMV